MRLLVLIVLLVIAVPDTTIKKKPAGNIQPATKTRSVELEKLNKRQAVQMIKLDSIIRVKDSLKKIKKDV